jgi:diguanylate cyclase (GGDEF)-like protein
MLDSHDHTLLRDDPAALPLRGRVHRPAHDALIGNAPLTAAATREVLATLLDLPPRALSGVSAVEARGALDRLLAMTERVRRLEEEAAVDDLTGVLRRGAGMRMLQAEVDRVRRGGGRLVLAFADVDGLKAVNDTRGHLAGDLLLQQVAHTLRRRLRSYDLVMRYGGDEFVCVLTGAGVTEARVKLDLVAAELRSVAGREVLSIGLAELDSGDPCDTAMTLVGRADAALYHGRAHRAAS